MVVGDCGHVHRYLLHSFKADLPCNRDHGYLKKYFLILKQVFISLVLKLPPCGFTQIHKHIENNDKIIITYFSICISLS